MIAAVSRKFSEQEQSFINNSESAEERRAKFLRIWCLKESYLKAKGYGLSVPLDSISFQFNHPNLTKDIAVLDTQIFEEGERVDVKFMELLFDNHILAVCWDKFAPESSVEVLEPAEFLKTQNGVTNVDSPVMPLVNTFYEKPK